MGQPDGLTRGLSFMNDDELRESTENHIARNRFAWKKLVEKGYAEGSLITLDFFFTSPDETKANELAVHVAEETGYKAQAEFEDGEWAVKGTTKAAAISPELLAAWVKWMITAGQKFHSQFDGWNAAGF